MRKIVLFMSMSLDGYIEGPERQIGWHRVDDEVHSHFNSELKGMSAFLNGRVTYELMAEHWPTADADPSSTAPMIEYADIWRRMPKIVFSSTLDRADWNATVKRTVDVEEIKALKAEPGGDMALGGSDLAGTFRRLGLIDEYRVYVHPVLIGSGKPLFDGPGPQIDLELIETRTFGNGVVLLRY